MGSSLPDQNGLALELTFSPQWAKEPENPYIHAGLGGQSGGKQRREREQDGHGGGKRRSHTERRDFRQRKNAGVARLDDGRQSAGEAQERSNGSENVSLIVAFVPSAASLKTIGRRIGRTGKAYSLFEVATFFLDQPDYYEVRISVPHDAAARGQRLHRCEKCWRVFMEKTEAFSHVLAQHLDDFYSRDEQQSEPPEGNFVCVAKCGLSGELLGPPNFHRFNDRVIELHRARYSHMPIDDYRSKIVNVRDTELIERWRQEARKYEVYRPRGAQEQEALTKFSDLESHFARHCAGSAIRTGSSFVVPASSIERENGAVGAQVRKARHKERRFPLNFAITLKSAFRHLGLHTFKTANGEIFVTSIVPSSTRPLQSVPAVQKILEYIESHRGVGGQSLLTAALPGANAKELREGENHLRWLVGKGHVIEFSDGTFALPSAHRQQARAGKRTEERIGDAKHGDSDTKQIPAAESSDSARLNGEGREDVAIKTPSQALSCSSQ